MLLLQAVLLPKITTTIAAPSTATIAVAFTFSLTFTTNAEKDIVVSKGKVHFLAEAEADQVEESPRSALHTGRGIAGVFTLITHT